jgi:hypothetical protein
MLDRYEIDHCELEIELRAGAQFIKLSQVIYDQLTAARFPGQKEKMQALRNAIIELNKIWMENVKERKAFVIPVNLRGEYLQAKQYYAYLKANPSEFYQKETEKYEDLLREHKLVEEKIAQKEVEVSHVEDEVRHYVRDNRERINLELNKLRNKKIKYEALRDKRQRSWMPAFFIGNRKIDKLPSIAEKITRLEDELKRLSSYINRDLEDRYDYLRLLRDKRWDIGNQLHVPQDSRQIQKEHWNDAVSRAEVNMLFRRMDIEKAVKRYYAAEGRQNIHAMLIVYSLLSEIAAQMPNKTEKLIRDLLALNLLSDQLHCPDIGNLSVQALYKVIFEFKEEQRNKIITAKPKKDYLPELLMLALSSDFIALSLDSVGLYRKALASAEADNSVKTEGFHSALKK